MDKAKKGSSVIIINENESGWSKIRTENGKVGYVKTSKLENIIIVREE